MPNRIYVENPQPAPWRYGLMSVLTQAPTTDIHWVNGVDFQPDACAQGNVWPDPCGENPPLECMFDVVVTGVGNLDGEGEPDGTSTVTVTTTNVDELCENRTVTVTLEGFAPVQVITGGSPVEISDIVPADAEYDVTVVDVASGDGGSGTLTLDVDGDGTETVTVEVVINKAFIDGREVDFGDPFTLYAGLLCKLIDVEQAQDVIARRFAFAEPRALEAAFWTGAAGNYPALATDPDLVILPGVQVGIEQAVGILEQEIAERYGGVGVIHAPRYVMPFAAFAGLVVREGSTLTTPLGTLWAFGGGYEPTLGPAGEDPIVDGQSWIYATGQVVARRGEVRVLPPDGNALDRTTNNVTVLAERTWVLTRDCVTIAARVLLPESPPQTEMVALENQTISSSGCTEPFSLEGFDEGFLSVFAAGQTMSPTLTVRLEQQDAMGNWFPVTSLTQLTSAPNLVGANVGDTNTGFVFTKVGRVCWTFGGSGSFTGVDISLIVKGED